MKSIIQIFVFLAFSTFSMAQMAVNSNSDDAQATEEKVDSKSDFQVANSVATVNEINQCLQRSLRLPEEVVDNNIKGTVLLNIHIDEFGKIQKVDVVESLGDAVDNAILKAIAKIKKVEPVTVDGIAVAKTIQLPVRIQ